jgi:two-component system, cell cycle response regulator
MSAQTPYALIAISNANRAAAFRGVATETLRLDAVLVRDGDDALNEIAKRGLPALLIVDLSLPRVDGFTILRRVRRQSSEHQTHVIVVSAHESLRAAARELSGSLGISGILPLDVERQALRDMIFAGLDPARDAARIPAPAPVRETPSATRTSPALDPEEVVDRAAVEARRRYRMPVSVGYLRLADEESVTFHVAVHQDEVPPPLGDLVDLAVLRQVSMATEPLIVPSVEDHPLYAPLARVAKGTRGFAAVPIPSTKEHARAALCLIDTKPLTLGAADFDALAAFGRHAGLELDRVAAILPERKESTDLPNDVEALQHLAATDPLTGLANRRGGEKHIANEISRAKRERRPLSCILFDIDRFKQVNDTFGHQAGDQLLRDLSALMRRTVRAYDIIVRWGGEEFLLVLPGVDLTAARLLADRLRVAVEMMDTHGIGPVTVSAGAAEFENDYDFAATLRTADRRLYQAKAAGRNCVV